MLYKWLKIQKENQAIGSILFEQMMAHSHLEKSIF